MSRNKPANSVAKIKSLTQLNNEIISCRACPRLENWRNTVSNEKRKAYENERYWGRPIPSFGPNNAQLLIIGLAPGAHGANRTGRIFTGDRSGDFLFSSLYRNGLAKISTSTSVSDGQKLFKTRITCAVRCAPPSNKPNKSETNCCAPYLNREIELLLPTVRVFLALGNFAWRALIQSFRTIDPSAAREYLHPTPRFGHGAHFQAMMSDGTERLVVGSYHPSQQNTFTGKLTEKTFDAVVKFAANGIERDR